MEKLNPEERSEFEKICMKLEKLLGKKPKTKAVTTKKLPSNVEIFENHIIPKFTEGIKKVETAGEWGKIIEVKVDWNLNTDFINMTLEELSSIHKKIVDLKRDIQVIDNFSKFYRGLVYLTAHQKCDSKMFSKRITMLGLAK